VLSDAAFASVLTSSYRAKLLLPQLEPPVNTVSQVNRNAAARAEEQQNADKRQSAVNDAKRIDAQHLTAAALDRAAVLQRQLASAPLSKAPPPTDRVTISRVSEIAQQTLANVKASSEKGVLAEVVRAVASEASKVYTPRTVARRTVVVEPAVALPPPTTATFASSNAIATRQYQRNASPLSSEGGGSPQRSAASGVNVRA